MNNRPTLFFFACHLILIFLGSGCSLKMGSPVSGIHKIKIHLRVKNDSLGPLLGPKLDREIRKSLVKDGSFYLVNNPGDADALLVVKLTHFNDSTEAYRPGDTLLAAGLNLRASATVEFIDPKGNEVFQQKVSGNSSVLRKVSTRVPDEAMAMQALAESLAAEVVLSLLNQSW